MRSTCILLKYIIYFLPFLVDLLLDLLDELLFVPPKSGSFALEYGVRLLTYTKRMNEERVC